VGVSAFQTVFAGLMLIGGIVVLFGAILLRDGWGTELAQRELAQIPEWPMGRLDREPRQPWRVAVGGITAPGPDGMVTAPLSGVECVWYRVSVTRPLVRGDSTDEDVLVDHVAGDPIGLVNRSDRILVSADLFYRALLGTESPGVIEYPPLDGDIDTQARTLRARGLLTADLRRTKGVSIEEAVVRAGRRIVVVGQPRRHDGVTMLVPVGSARCGVSTESLASMRVRDTGGVRYDSSNLPVFLGMIGATMILCAAAIVRWF
jgi:hypothetical protein